MEMIYACETKVKDLEMGVFRFQVQARLLWETGQQSLLFGCQYSHQTTN